MVTRIPKRSKSFGRELNIVLDNMDKAIAELQLAATKVSSAEMAFNDSGSSVRRFMLYGRSASVENGKLALATAGASPVEPSFVALASVGDGDEFPISRGGRNCLLLEDPTVAITRGGWVWLSQTKPGKVTSAMPATGRRYRMGHFAKGTINADGSADCWLTIFPQAGGAL